MIRAVLDTNILVRAVLQPRGTVGFVTRGIGESRFTVLYSDTMGILIVGPATFEEMLLEAETGEM